MLQLSEFEQAVFDVIKQSGDELPDLPVEFWQSAMDLRSMGLVEFVHGMWRAIAEPVPVTNEI